MVVVEVAVGNRELVPSEIQQVVEVAGVYRTLEEDSFRKACSTAVVREVPVGLTIIIKTDR